MKASNPQFHRDSEALSGCDEELVQRVIAGDEQAWALFLERHSSLIYYKARQ